jgi:Mg-chelatase subunit ChlD
MKLAAAAAFFASASLAHAETSLTEDAPGMLPQPSTQLFEAACDIDVDLHGAVAQVEVRQRIVNPGPDALAATYELDLPRGATLTGFSLRTDGPPETALPISGAFTSVDAATRPVLGVDPALVTLLPAGSAAQYAVRLQPIAADHELVMTTRYTTIGQIRSGAIRVVLPGRGTRGKLTACRGTVRASAGPGATIQGFRIDKVVTARSSATFVLDTQDLAIDATLGFTGREPLVWTQSEPLVDGWLATLVTVVAPPIKTTTAQARRALFVIDGSRSMELVGKQNVTKVIGTIAAALPAGIEVDAIIYDRTATRVFKTWKPGSAASVTEIQTAVTNHVAQNGSSIGTAFELAHAAITDGARAQTMVIVVSDGVLGEVSGPELTRSLGMKTSTVDVVAVVLDPASTRSPDAAVLRSPVNLFGGSFVELAVDEIDEALQVVDEWMRPSWLELAMGDLDIPASVRAGSGFTHTVIHRGDTAKFTLTGHGDTSIKIAPRVGPAAPTATLTLAAIPADAVPFTYQPDPSDDERERVAKVRSRALAAHPYVRDALALAVLTTQGKIARNRIAMVKGGGPYERITALDDTGPIVAAGTAPAKALPPPSAIAKITLERLFRDQLQPKAFACYQRALGTEPKLSGTVFFELHLGRGEITQVTLTGLGSAQLDDCLRDAAYALSVPFPDFTINADDQTIAHYPLTFNVAEAKPLVVLGDADSSSPLDIDAIEGGVPVKARGQFHPNAATPLGNLRPGRSP